MVEMIGDKTRNIIINTRAKNEMNPPTTTTTKNKNIPKIMMNDMRREKGIRGLSMRSHWEWP